MSEQINDYINKIINLDFIQALKMTFVPVSYTHLWNETLHHHFSNVKSATGASDYVILGNMTLPPR